MPLGEWRGGYAPEGPLGEAEQRLRSGELCTTLRGGESVLFAWNGQPDVPYVSCELDNRYRLQFRMMSTVDVDSSSSQEAPQNGKGVR